MSGEGQAELATPGKTFFGRAHGGVRQGVPGLRESFQHVGGGYALKASLAPVSLERMWADAGEQESDAGVEGSEARSHLG